VVATTVVNGSQGVTGFPGSSASSGPTHHEPIPYGARDGTHVKLNTTMIEHPKGDTFHYPADPQVAFFSSEGFKSETLPREVRHRRKQCHLASIFRTVVR
jgi:hypothetical protein